MVASHPRDDIQRGFVAAMYLFATVFAFSLGYGLATSEPRGLLVILAVATTTLFLVASGTLQGVGA